MLTEGDAVNITSFFDLTLAFNKGISFGLFSEVGDLSLLAFTTTALALLVIWALVAERRSEYLGITLIASGGISNSIDRFSRSAVTDFLDFHIGSFYWPTFNFADVGITIGVTTLILVPLFGDSFGRAPKGLHGIHLFKPWCVVCEPETGSAEGYLTIVNNGTTPDRLVRGSFERAEITEIYEIMQGSDGAKYMREASLGLLVKPNETLELSPGRAHMKFSNLSASLHAGARVKGTLQFKKAGTIDVEYLVKRSLG